VIFLRRASRLWPRFSALVLLALACPCRAHAEPTEQEVKAALIFNITRFVEWPVGTFRSPDAPLVVALLGQDEVSAVLEQMLLHKTVDGHPVEVRRVSVAGDAASCQVVYVATSEERRIGAILKALHGTPTLTVAEINPFAELGGHVELALEDRRIRVLVNPVSARASHLKISAKLLSLARIVDEAP